MLNVINKSEIYFRNSIGQVIRENKGIEQLKIHIYLINIYTIGPILIDQLLFFCTNI